MPTSHNIKLASHAPQLLYNKPKGIATIITM